MATPINARLPDELARYAKDAAAAGGMTLTDFLTAMLAAHQTETGPAAAAKKIKELEATIREQERIVRRHRRGGTPTQKRVSMSMPLAAIDELDGRARRAGLSRTEYMRACLDDAGRRRPAIQAAAADKPALPE